MVIFVLNMLDMEKPYTTQTAINCMGVFYKTSFLFQVQRIFDADQLGSYQCSMFAGNQVMSLRTYIKHVTIHFIFKYN